MKKIISIVAAMGIVCALTACSRGGETESTSSEPTVGDFNFIQQAPVTSSSSSGMQVSVSGGDGEVSGGLPISPDTSIELETSEPAEESGYKDLSTNSSLQLGANVYVSIPTAQVYPCCTLDEFLRSSRVAYNLVPETQWNTLPIQKEAYKYGSCVHSEETRMLIEGIGFSYWCTNQESSLDVAKSPSIGLFNLGTLTADSGETYASSYRKLGELQDEEETDFYYRAVYTIADVDNLSAVEAYAALIFDKGTNTLATCLIATSNLYKETGATFTADIAISSFRYSTVTPENLMRIF